MYIKSFSKSTLMFNVLLSANESCCCYFSVNISGLDRPSAEGKNKPIFLCWNFQ